MTLPGKELQSAANMVEPFCPACRERDARIAELAIRLAELQRVSGGAWGGCVYDVDAIVSRLG